MIGLISCSIFHLLKTFTQVREKVTGGRETLGTYKKIYVEHSGFILRPIRNDCDLQRSTYSIKGFITGTFK